MMSNDLATAVNDILDKYEVPQEYIDAVIDAYTEGVKRGFIDASVKLFNSQEG